jgi:hypothetical protein
LRTLFRRSGVTSSRLLGGLLELLLHGAGGRRELDREGHPPSVELDVLHEAQIYDGAAKVRILDGSQCAENLRLGDLTHFLPLKP